MTLRVIDDRGRTVELDGPPRRIVSLFPSATELVSALDAADRLVGLTRYCVPPTGVRQECSTVGGTKDPDCERVLELQPDVVLVSPEENRRIDFDCLCAAGVAVFVIAPTSVSAVIETVHRLGILLDAQAAAAALGNEIAATCRRAIDSLTRRVSVFCPIWRNPWMSFGRDTYAHDLLWHAGGDNVCADTAQPYARVDLERIVDRAPEVILLPDEPYPFAASDAEFLRTLADTAAWRNAKLQPVEGRDLFWYGPRTPAALDALSAILQAIGQQYFSM